MLFFIVFIFYLCLIVIVRGQDCKVSGQRCADHEQCCGGCCFDAICINTYRSCLTPYDVCKDHACRGEENCFVYKPPGCRGCEALPLCKLDEPL